MQITAYVVGAVMVGALLVAWIGGRLSERLVSPLTVAKLVVIRISLGVLLLVAAAEAATHGGYAWIVFPVFLFLALFSLAIGGGLIWLWATGRLDDDEPAGGD